MAAPRPRLVARSVTATDGPPATTRGGARSGPTSGRWSDAGGSTPADHRDVVRDPLLVRHAHGARVRREAIGLRGLPELDLVEVLDAVHDAAVGTEQFVAVTGGRHRGHRAEPRGQVALH